jgi:tetratricopeptide (TPR) repeat protein
MINLGISLLVYALLLLALNFGTGLSLIYSALLALLGFAGSFFLLSRRTSKQLTAVMEGVQRDMQAGRADKAVKTLQSAYPLGKWQFFVTSQIEAQIGCILYLKRDFAQAFDHLQKGFSRHWVAMSMLAICYMKRNNSEKMKAAFEKAVAATKNESLPWSLYAFCLEKVGERNKAIEILEKGIKKGAADDTLLVNLGLLQEGKKMKMKGYGDLWHQFHLEKQGAVIKQQTRAVQGRRKTVRR